MFKKGINLLFKILKKQHVITGIPVIIKNKEKVLLGKRAKTMHCYPSMWGLPGGLMEYNESIEKATKREIKEELGINVEITKQGKPFNQLPTKECPMHVLNLPIYCRIKNNEKPKAKDETTHVRWFEPEEIKNMKLAYCHKEILQQEGII